MWNLKMAHPQPLHMRELPPHMQERSKHMHGAPAHMQDHRRCIRHGSSRLKRTGCQHCGGLMLQSLHLVSLSAQCWAIRCGAMTWRSLSSRIWGSFLHTCRSFRCMCMLPPRTRRLTSRPLRHGIVSLKRLCCPRCLRLSLMPRLHPLI